ncbi:MAG: redoxin domain-containing protein [Flavisolibacter sp.]
MALQPGQYAPDFTLYDTEKSPVTLSSFRGEQVLILFFPLAFTSVCTAELCSVRDNLRMYEELDVRPIGISVDSVYSLAKFKSEQKINFPLLSDFNKEVSKSYDALYETFGLGMKGVSKRAAYLIDREGRISYAEVLENAGLQPDFTAIQGKLRELAG